MNLDRRRFVRRVASGGALIAASPWLRAGSTPVTLKWANDIPATHPSSQRIQEAADAIRAETGGKVDIHLFPDNQLGGDSDMLSQVRLGAIDFFSLSGLILQGLVPVAGINGMAFAFKDYETVWAAMDGDLGAYVRAAIGKVDLHVFEKCLDSGYRNITSSTRPILTVADLKGFKIRVPVSPLWTSLFKALDASPASIDFSEAYSALQTRIVDGQENPLAVIEESRLYEVQKYCAMTGHMWDGDWILANGRRWSALPESTQEVITRHVVRAVLKQREDIRFLDSALETKLKARGLAFNYPDRESFRRALSGAGFYAAWRGKFGEEAMTRLERYSGKLS